MSRDDAGQIFFSSFLMKTKVVQNVNRMSENQKDRPADSQTDRKTDRKPKRLFSLVSKTKVVQNVNRMSQNFMSENNMSVCQYDMSESNFSV